MCSTENLSHILSCALNLLIHEIIASQVIYVRAISYFIYKELKALSNNPSSIKSCTTCSSGAIQICLCDQRKILEFLEDFEASCDITEPRQLGAGHFNCGKLGEETTRFIDTCNGLYCYEDFSTALVVLNRSVFCSKHLSDEERRKHIFCADQVLP